MKGKMGRPTTYLPKYCDELIEHMKEGLSFESFAGVIGVHSDTLYEWADKHYDFSDAKKKAFAACLLWWEKKGISGLDTESSREGQSGWSKSMNAAVWIFNMKARFRKQWADPGLEDAIKPKAIQEKYSFIDFAINSGYPPPYPKQVEMMKFGIDSTGARMILGARGYGKTDYVVILGLAYKIYIDPSFTSLIVTKSDERNASMLSEIAKALQANGVNLEKQNASCIRTIGLIGKDHSVSTVTVGTSSIRGRHPQIVVMDDPVTEEDVSEATRKKVQRVYNEVSKLCSNVLVIGQPVHKFDLYESLRPLLKKLEVPHGSIPELDHDLEAQRLAGVDESSIQASYFLKVISESSSPFEKIRYMDKYPSGDSAVAFIDPSFEGGDYTALTIMKAYMQGVAVVGFSYKKAWNHALDDIALKLTKYGVRRLCFETNSLGNQPIELMRGVFKDIGIVGRKSNGNKHSRIVAAGTFAHMIHLCRESDRIYIDQVVKYEYKSKYDDCPDSLASCLEWIGLIRGKQ